MDLFYRFLAGEARRVLKVHGTRIQIPESQPVLQRITHLRGQFVRTQFFDRIDLYRQQIVRKLFTHGLHSRGKSPRENHRLSVEKRPRHNQSLSLFGTK